MTSSKFFQQGFLKWEKQGKLYRLDKDMLPTKFKDATLCKGQLEVIQKVQKVVQRGGVELIEDDGTIHFNDGMSMQLPWSTTNVAFVHCSAGAFNYSKQTKKPAPVFSRN